MKLHYQIRSVLLSQNSSAVTLSPASWFRDSETETEMFDGEVIPKSIECEPGDPGAEPMEMGGKMTELRFDTVTDLVPGEWLTVTFNRSRPDV